VPHAIALPVGATSLALRTAATLSESFLDAAAPANVKQFISDGRIDTPPPIIRRLAVSKFPENRENNREF
jgi:hypothetical protein